MPAAPHARSWDDVAERAELIVGHRFADRDLLRQALTHPSAAEAPGAASYERLEFLGDSLIGMFVAREVFEAFPDTDEGGMTRVKNAVVSGSVLTEVAAELGLADVIIMGESERGTGSRGMTSALENVFEALTAALYLDAGEPQARRFVLESLSSRIAAIDAEAADNPKGELQELLQRNGAAPSYHILSHEGPPHDRTFVAQVRDVDKVLGEGIGRSKKEAEAAAARAALERLSKA